MEKCQLCGVSTDDSEMGMIFVDRRGIPFEACAKCGSHLECIHSSADQTEIKKAYETVLDMAVCVEPLEKRHSIIEYVQSMPAYQKIRLRKINRFLAFVLIIVFSLILISRSFSTASEFVTYLQLEPLALKVDSIATPEQTDKVAYLVYQNGRENICYLFLRSNMSEDAIQKYFLSMMANFGDDNPKRKIAVKVEKTDGFDVLYMLSIAHHKKTYNRVDENLGYYRVTISEKKK